MFADQTGPSKTNYRLSDSSRAFLEAAGVLEVEEGEQEEAIVKLD